MPAKGKHRRPKPHRFARRLAVAGTGGAALALPLMGAAGAHAAPDHAPAHKERTAAPKATEDASYTVRAHDTLGKIAHDQHVKGGWKHIYRANHQLIGHDPDLILPGQKLKLGGGAAHSGASHTKASHTKASHTKASRTAARSGSGYTLPVDGATLGTPYHQSGGMWSSGYHTGQDFIVPNGTQVRAVAAGHVVSAGWGGSYGNQVVIQHGDGKYTQYGHMSSLKVAAGQTVTEGQEIGLSGATGNVTGPHLHFEVRTTPDYGSDIDPLTYLRAHGLGI